MHHGMTIASLRQTRTKMDQRVERPEAQGDGDWSFIGHTGDEETSILVWYVRLQQFHGYRPDRRGPMFLNHERSGAYLYSQFLRDFHVLQLRAGVSKDDLTGTAGLRSAGYTGTRNILGAALAQAHGGWAVKSLVHNRYYRFESMRVARIPLAIMGLIEEDLLHEEEVDNRVVERPSQRPSERITRESFALEARAVESPSLIGESSSAPLLVPTSTLPEGWTEEVRMPASGRAYSIFHGPDGERASSRLQAWRSHNTQAEPGVSSAELIQRAADAECVDDDDDDGYISGGSAEAYANFAAEREQREREGLLGTSTAIVSSTLTEPESSSAPLAATPNLRRLLPSRVHTVVQRWSPSFASDRNAA